MQDELRLGLERLQEEQMSWFPKKSGVFLIVPGERKDWVREWRKKAGTGLGARLVDNFLQGYRGSAAGWAPMQRQSLRLGG